MNKFIFAIPIIILGLAIVVVLGIMLNSLLYFDGGKRYDDIATSTFSVKSTALDDAKGFVQGHYIVYEWSPEVCFTRIFSSTRRVFWSEVKFRNKVSQGCTPPPNDARDPSLPYFDVPIDTTPKDIKARLLKEYEAYRKRQNDDNEMIRKINSQ